MNVWFNEIRFARQKPGSSVFEEAGRHIDLADAQWLRSLREGDRIEDGRIVDRDGREVPVRDAAGKPVSLQVGPEGYTH